MGEKKLRGKVINTGEMHCIPSSSVAGSDSSQRIDTWFHTLAHTSTQQIVNLKWAIVFADTIAAEINPSIEPDGNVQCGEEEKEV